MKSELRTQFQGALDAIDEAGLRKRERPIGGPQGPHVQVSGVELVNFCSNNYLGLANHPAVIDAAKSALDVWGFGMASVRFISGTQEIHLELEAALSAFLNTEATILFPSCFDANGAIFEVLLDPEDAVISDALNHASIIDGIRLSKASRYRYANRDMADLKTQLVAARGARRRLIVTDGVFSMDGTYAPLVEICALADEHDAIVMVDDSHATGFVGGSGRGTPELFGVADRVDILTGTLGKALGGATGGYVSGSQPVIELLRQRARPYLFSNAVPPSSVAGALAALEVVDTDHARRDRLWRNARVMRTRLQEEQLQVLSGEHAIVPVMFADEREAATVAQRLFERGIYATAFTYPVVPVGRARIRLQLSADHSDADIEAAVLALTQATKLAS